MPSLARRTFLTSLAATGAGALVAACSARGADGDDAGTGEEVPVRDGDPLDSGDGIFRRRVSYADHSEGFADLWLPRGEGASAVVVLIHGGFWQEQFRLDLMDALARDLARRGHAAWNIEYRRVGGGGGYPETFADVAAAVDHLADVDAGLADDLAARLDLDRVAVVGHSAGGHLSAWVASRGVLPAAAVGADPAVTPVVAVSQAGVLDLVDCAARDLGGTPCPDLLGGDPDERPERYAQTSPLALVPVGLPVIAVHGTADSVVPVAQSRRYVDAATEAGDPAELVEFDGVDHFELIDPTHESWQAVLDVLGDHLG